MSVSAEAFAGGSVKATLSADAHLSARKQRLALIDAGASPWSIVLADARRLRPDAATYVVGNIGSTVLSVEDADGNRIATVTHGKIREFSLLDKTTKAGIWTYTAEASLTVGSNL